MSSCREDEVTSGRPAARRDSKRVDQSRCSEPGHRFSAYRATRSPLGDRHAGKREVPVDGIVLRRAALEEVIDLRHAVLRAGCRATPRSSRATTRGRRATTARSATAKCSAARRSTRASGKGSRRFSSRDGDVAGCAAQRARAARDGVHRAGRAPRPAVRSCGGATPACRRWSSTRRWAGVWRRKNSTSRQRGRT